MSTLPRHIDFPFQFDPRGSTADVEHADYIRDLLELLLFTNPGERVNRPDFGGGIRPLVFAPNSTELAATLKFTIQSNLQRFLGSLIDVQSLTVDAVEASLTITIRYSVRRTGEVRTEQMNRSL